MEPEIEATNEAAPATDKVIPRDPPKDIRPERKALVKWWLSEVQRGEEHHRRAFDRMKRWEDFVYGKQWPVLPEDPYDRPYVANIVLRHIQQKTAKLYAKNPKAVARPAKKLLYKVWDGQGQTLAQAQAVLQGAGTGMVPPELAQQAMMEAQLLIQDIAEAKGLMSQIKRMGETLEVLFHHNLREQTLDFKQMMKTTVRRTQVYGVSYVKLGYQRVMEPRPGLERDIADATERLATLQRLAADLSDKELDKYAPEMEQLNLMIQDLNANPEVLAREGLVLDYPMPNAIIPDPKCIQLREFVGANWVAERFLLTPDEIEEIYGVDVKNNFTAFESQNNALTLESFLQDPGQDKKKQTQAKVYEIYCRKDGLVYTVCEGYPDFLREPASPDPYMERFWPWFPLVFNEVPNQTEIYPPSDVELLWHAQMEYNRSRQGLREHRKANRPMFAVPEGRLSEEDKDKLTERPSMAVIELKGLDPGMKVQDLIQAFQGAPIDPAMYDTSQAMDDIMRTVGVQEAGMGSTAPGGTSATEVSIADASLATAQSSNVDDLDDMLSALARSAGQILLLNTTPETVAKIVGPANVWPQLDKETVATEILLEIEAGSSGRPNQAREIQNAERLIPLLMQVPGVTPEWIAKEVIKRLDDRIDLDEALTQGVPSITAMNGMKSSGPGGMSPEPAMQGPMGSQAGNTPPPGPPAASSRQPGVGGQETNPVVGN